MKRSRNRIAAALTAVLAGGLAAFALRPSDKPTATLAAQHPVVEVRTQVIRRTIHVVRHQSAGHHPAPRGAVATGSPGSGKRGGAAGAVRTGSSGAHAASGSGAGSYVAASGAVTTRSSGSHASTPSTSSAPSSSGSAPVRTRTSGSAGSTGTSSHPSSGGGAKPVTTRSSGSKGGDGGDGGHGHSSGD
jgi:hypothetical protein